MQAIEPTSVWVLIVILVTGAALTLRSERASIRQRDLYAGNPFFRPDLGGGSWKIWFGFFLGVVFSVFMYVLFGDWFFETLLLGLEELLR